MAEHQDRAPSTEERSISAKGNGSERLLLVRTVWPWAFLILMVISFTIASKQVNDVAFLTPISIQSILRYATQILLVGLGETLIIIAAGIDLSLGWTLGFSAVIGASVMRTLQASGVSPAVTIGLGMLSGIVIAVIPGLLNGVLVAKIKVPPFISTLGMGGLVKGAALLQSGGYPVAEQPPTLGKLGNSYVFYLWPEHSPSFFKLPDAATSADLADITPILPTVVLVTIFVTLIVWFILAKTQFGQHLYAIGGNFEASMRAGIPVQKTLIQVYAIAGVLAGVAGVLWAARYSSGAYNAGETTVLDSIAAVVIGGASLFGGEGTIVGTVVGALIIATIQFGLPFLGMMPFWQYVAVGTVVILAVIVDQFGRTLGK